MGQPQPGNFTEGNEENEGSRRRFRLPSRRLPGIVRHDRTPCSGRSSCPMRRPRTMAMVLAPHPAVRRQSAGCRFIDASQFGALSGPSFLTQFAYRPDRILGQSGPRSWTLRIYASTTSRSVAGLSTTFAENIGTNNTLVFDGTVNCDNGESARPWKHPAV